MKPIKKEVQNKNIKDEIETLRSDAALCVGEAKAIVGLGSKVSGINDMTDIEWYSVFGALARLLEKIDDNLKKMDDILIHDK